MNLKALFAIIGVLFVALFGYNYYSSKKSAEKIAAMQAEAAKTRAETEKMAVQNANLDKQKDMEERHTMQQNALNSIRIPPGKNELLSGYNKWLKANIGAVRDINAVANQVALVADLKALEEARQEIESINGTDCVNSAKEDYIKAMRLTETGFSNYMSDKANNKELFVPYAKQAKEIFDKAGASLNACKN